MWAPVLTHAGSAGRSLHDVIHATPSVQLSTRQVLEYTAQVCSNLPTHVKPSRVPLRTVGSLSPALFPVLVRNIESVCV